MKLEQQNMFESWWGGGGGETIAVCVSTQQLGASGGMLPMKRFFKLDGLKLLLN